MDVGPNDINKIFYTISIFNSPKYIGSIKQKYEKQKTKFNHFQMVFENTEI